MGLDRRPLVLWWIKSVDLAGSEGRFEVHIKQAASKTGLPLKVTQRPRWSRKRTRNCSRTPAVVKGWAFFLYWLNLIKRNKVNGWEYILTVQCRPLLKVDDVIKDQRFGHNWVTRESASSCFEGQRHSFLSRRSGLKRKLSNTFHWIRSSD